MSSSNTNEVLNRLLAVHSRSLPMYLHFAVPFSTSANGAVRDVLSRIVVDQNHMADRIGELIVENGGDVESADFPMMYTAWHDLSCDFLLDKMIDRQKADVKEIEQCVAKLSLAPYARAVAEEALGAAKGHLDSLVELKARR